MKLNKGEVIIKEGNMQVGINPGTVRLTNQRLLLEYFEVEFPFPNLFSKPAKKEIEIPLTSIRDVKPAIQVDYSAERGLKTLHFTPNVSLLEVDIAGGGKLTGFGYAGAVLEASEAYKNEWLAQIRKAANLPAKK